MTFFVLDKEHSADDALMNEYANFFFNKRTITHAKPFIRDRELFGPFLPILPVEGVDEAINFVRARFVSSFGNDFMTFELINSQ